MLGTVLNPLLISQMPVQTSNWGPDNTTKKWFHYWGFHLRLSEMKQESMGPEKIKLLFLSAWVSEVSEQERNKARPLMQHLVGDVPVENMPHF